MSKTNTKDIEILYFIKSFLKKDFPKYMSKNFSYKTMERINHQPKLTYFKYFTKIAIASSFAIVTLLLVKVMTIDNLNYTQTSISKTRITVPKHNVSNQKLDENCKKNNSEKVNLDNKECK